MKRKRRKAVAEERTGHWITPTINAGDGVHLKVTCHEPEGAECRQVVVRGGDVNWDSLLVEPVVTEDGGYCQWVDFYASTGEEGYFYEGPDDHPVVEGPISIRYETPRGDDDGGAFCWTYIEEQGS